MFGRKNLLRLKKIIFNTNIFFNIFFTVKNFFFDRTSSKSVDCFAEYENYFLIIPIGTFSKYVLMPLQIFCMATFEIVFLFFLIGSLMSTPVF